MAKFVAMAFDGPLTARAWFVAIAVVVLQLTAVAWGFAVLH